MSDHSRGAQPPWAPHAFAPPDGQRLGPEPITMVTASICTALSFVTVNVLMQAALWFLELPRPFLLVVPLATASVVAQLTAQALVADRALAERITARVATVTIYVGSVLLFAHAVNLWADDSAVGIVATRWLALLVLMAFPTAVCAGICLLTVAVMRRVTRRTH